MEGCIEEEREGSVGREMEILQRSRVSRNGTYILRAWVMKTLSLAQRNEDNLRQRRGFIPARLVV